MHIKLLCHKSYDGGEISCDTSFLYTVHTNKQILSKNVKKCTCISNIVALMCKFLTLNLLYFSSNKKYKNSNSFKSINLSDFLFPIYNVFEDDSLYIDVILLKVKCTCTLFSKIFIISLVGVYRICFHNWDCKHSKTLNVWEILVNIKVVNETTKWV